MKDTYVILQPRATDLTVSSRAIAKIAPRGLLSLGYRNPLRYAGQQNSHTYNFPGLAS